MQLDPSQAQALFEAGAYILISDLPPGSEVSIDNDMHYITQKFEGWKMIPPGIHLITWSIPSTSTATDQSNPSGLSLRHGLFRTLSPKQTLTLRYSPREEDLVPTLTDEHGIEVETIVGKEFLKTMDPRLAPYPFKQLDGWKAFTSHIKSTDLEHVLGRSGKADGLMEAEGEEEARLASIPTREGHVNKEAVKAMSLGEDGVAEDVLKFVVFDGKRSWRNGAVGEEVTQFSRDKSWLFVDVLLNQLDCKPSTLLAHLQLSFLLFLRLYNFSSLTIHKSILFLLARSSSTLLTGLRTTNVLLPLFPNASTPKIKSMLDQERMISFYTEFVEVLIDQIKALPSDCFSKDLDGTGLEEYWIAEMDHLYRGVASALKTNTHSYADFKPLEDKMNELKVLAASKFGWDLIDLREYNRLIGEEEDWIDETGYIEEGEDAPVIVEMEEGSY